jgi:hypothetical protein
LDVPDEERRQAAKTEELVRKKLLAIMDLQADIDALLRDGPSTPFGSQKWQDAGPEMLQRLVLMTALQFVLFEPVGWVPGNAEFKTVAERILPILSAQVRTLKKDASPG